MGSWVSERDHSHGLALVGACSEARTRSELVDLMLAGLQPLMAGDEVSCSALNPTTGQVTCSWGYPTRTVDLPQATRLWQTRPHDHPWMLHYTRTRNDSTFVVSDLYPGRGLQKLAYYADFYKPRHVRYAAYSVITHSGRLVVGVGVGRWRTDVTDRERDLFELLRRPLGALWQLAWAREQQTRRPEPPIEASEQSELRSVGDAFDDLTPGEREVVLLLARGWDNRHIAVALRVSVKAVEQHLTHAYRKLGVSSRTQLVLRLIPTAGGPTSGNPYR